LFAMITPVIVARAILTNISRVIVNSYYLGFANQFLAIFAMGIVIIFAFFANVLSSSYVIHTFTILYFLPTFETINHISLIHSGRLLLKLIFSLLTL